MFFCVCSFFNICEWSYDVRSCLQISYWDVSLCCFLSFLVFLFVLSHIKIYFCLIFEGWHILCCEFYSYCSPRWKPVCDLVVPKFFFLSFLLFCVEWYIYCVFVTWLLTLFFFVCFVLRCVATVHSIRLAFGGCCCYWTDNVLICCVLFYFVPFLFLSFCFRF